LIVSPPQFNPRFNALNVSWVQWEIFVDNLRGRATYVWGQVARSSAHKRKMTYL
jgi:hypothetical protein